MTSTKDQNTMTSTFLSGGDKAAFRDSLVAGMAERLITTIWSLTQEAHGRAGISPDVLDHDSALQAEARGHAWRLLGMMQARGNSMPLDDLLEAVRVNYENAVDLHDMVAALFAGDESDAPDEMRADAEQVGAARVMGRWLMARALDTDKKSDCMLAVPALDVPYEFSERMAAYLQPVNLDILHPGQVIVAGRHGRPELVVQVAKVDAVNGMASGTVVDEGFDFDDRSCFVNLESGKVDTGTLAGPGVQVVLTAPLAVVTKAVTAADVPAILAEAEAILADIRAVEIADGNERSLSPM